MPEQTIANCLATSWISIPHLYNHEERILISATIQVQLSVTLLCANQNYWLQIDYKSKGSTLWESIVIESIYWELVTAYILNTK